MRILWVAAAAVSAAFAAAFVAAFAGPAAAGHCCQPFYGPPIYGAPPVPSPGYPLAEQINPFYVVNEGPVYAGPGLYANTNIYYPSLPRPIYSVGGYAFVQAYYPPAMQVPYVHAFGGWRCYGGYGECAPYGAPRPHYYARARFAPYGAQIYRGGPGARVIALPSRGY